MAKNPVERQIEVEWENSYKKADIPNMPWEAFKPPSRLVKLIDAGKIRLGKAIDLGCGLGTNAVYLARKGFEVTALDVSETALKYASRQTEKEKVKVDFVKGFAHKLDFPDKTFTLVFDRGCFHHIPPELREEYIKGVHRVLVDKGSYYLEAFSAECVFDFGEKFSKEDLQKLFGGRFNIIFIEEMRNKNPEGEVVLNAAFMEKK